MIFDVHAHNVESQNGGILIALEGKPRFENTYDNQSLKNFMDTSGNSNFLPCYYVDSSFSDLSDNSIIKYHPRREKYSVQEVISDIRVRNPKLCIIDTLNQPYWSPFDYWKVVLAFPCIQFILAHSGGYDIIEFIKIGDFNKNVWLDFSLTQEYFGWCGEKEKLNYVADTIDYCLQSSKIAEKVLFASDIPFCSQNNALKKYLELKNAEIFLESNYRRLIDSLKL
jgi:hypothetical protein